MPLGRHRFPRAGRMSDSSPHYTPAMSKAKVQAVVIWVVSVAFVASALGYLFAPSTMLSIVGMESTPAADFLVRTLAAALLALTPGAWAARRRSGSSDQRGILVGLAVYMFVSSIVDLRAFMGDVVGIASIPSIVLRVAVGGALVWLVPRRDVPEPDPGARVERRRGRA
jgi:hypothetical protein